PFFADVKQDGQLANVTDVTNYYRDAKAGTLPAVSWITPSGPNSEHPPARVDTGQTWVTSLFNAAMGSPRLAEHRHLPVLGRLGRLLRPRGTAARRPERLRPPGAGHRHQPVGQVGDDRPSGPVPRRL